MQKLSVPHHLAHMDESLLHSGLPEVGGLPAHMSINFGFCNHPITKDPNAMEGGRKERKEFFFKVPLPTHPAVEQK